MVIVHILNLLIITQMVHTWSGVGVLAPGSCWHSSLVSTGTVTACRLLEWGAASPTPSLPQPVTVARVPASSTSPGGGRQIEEMVGVGFT